MKIAFSCIEKNPNPSAQVAGLTPAQRVEYDAAVGSDNKPEIARLLALGAAANGKSGTIAGAVAGLTPAQRVEYEAAVASNNVTTTSPRSSACWARAWPPTPKRPARLRVTS